RIWSRQPTGSQQTAWRGLDFSAPSDTSLLSPELVVGDGPLVVTFDHKFTFEEGDDQQGHEFFDGGFIEITSEHGATWQDVSELGAMPGYGGTITDTSGNPDAGRDAYVSQNASWPMYDKVTLNFGDRIKNRTVQLRFRIGSDQASGAFGW